MICPKCKNPIDDATTTCEWCGAVVKTQSTTQATATTGNKAAGVIVLLLAVVGVVYLLLRLFGAL
jgi:hypothetical protein